MTHTHQPDAWIILRIASHDGETHHRVMGGWVGGYTDGDSWRINSGITEARDCGDTYEFDGESGSTYICNKSSERATVLMASVLGSLARDDFTVTVIPAEDYFNLV